MPILALVVGAPPPLRAVAAFRHDPPTRHLGAPPPLRLVAATPVAAFCHDVLEALQAFARGRPELLAATSDGRLWEVEAPEDADFPLAVCFLVSELDDVVTTGDSKLVRSVVQVSCQAATSRAAKDLRRRFEAALDNAPLAIQGRPVRLCHPRAPTATKGEGKGPRGEDWWIAAFELEVLWDQPRPVRFRP